MGSSCGGSRRRRGRWRKRRHRGDDGRRDSVMRGMRVLMRVKPTRQALRTWVRGAGLAALILAVVMMFDLFPKVLEAEHRWLVARCPIAYVGEDGRIHLTNEAGTLHV